MPRHFADQTEISTSVSRNAWLQLSSVAKITFILLFHSKVLWKTPCEGFSVFKKKHRKQTDRPTAINAQGMWKIFSN